jgi:NADH:ubiquinone oxidoreductase subunit E
VAKKGTLIEELQEIQSKNGFLPMKELEKLSKSRKIPGTDIFAVATFYNQFRFNPPAKYTIYVCTGTACHVKKSPELIRQIGSALGIKPGETTKNNLIKLETVNCIGACAKAPSMMVNDKVYGLVDKSKLNEILEGLK